MLNIDRELCKYVEAVHGVAVLSPDKFVEIRPSLLIIASRCYEVEIQIQAESMATWPVRTVPLLDLIKPNILSDILAESPV